MGGVPAEGAQRQLTGQALPSEEKVDGPVLDAVGLARPRARDGQQGALRVGDNLPLPDVQLRMSA